jgi:hypothetical protein
MDSRFEWFRIIRLLLQNGLRVVVKSGGRRREFSRDDGLRASVNRRFLQNLLLRYAIRLPGKPDFLFDHLGQHG